MKSGMNVLRAFLFVGCMTLALASESATASERSSTDQDIVEGMKLSEEDAQLLDETFKHHPEDLSMRNKLLAYYSGVHSEWFHNIRNQEVLWIIEHHPEAPIAGLPYARFDANVDSRRIRKARHFGSGRSRSTRMNRSSCATRRTIFCSMIVLLLKIF